MRTVSTKVIENAVYESLITATYKLPEDIKKALKRAYEKETSQLAKYVLSQIIKNYEIAQAEKLSLCQDTGRITIFVEMGQDVIFSDGFLLSSLNKAISRATTEGYLRNSTFTNPLQQHNTPVNIPPILHIEIVRGDRVKIYIMLKGGGSENVSMLKMLPPSADREIVKQQVLNWVKANVAKACPPVVVGIGIGGSYEYSAILAKKALLRKLGASNKNEFYAKMEKEILDEINKTGIGPMGVGGKSTALAVHIETAPTHIASLPLAVAFNCHSARLSKIVI